MNLLDDPICTLLRLSAIALALALAASYSPRHQEQPLGSDTRRAGSLAFTEVDLLSFCMVIKLT